MKKIIVDDNTYNAIFECIRDAYTAETDCMAFEDRQQSEDAMNVLLKTIAEQTYEIQENEDEINGSAKLIPFLKYLVEKNIRNGWQYNLVKENIWYEIFIKNQRGRKISLYFYRDTEIVDLDTKPSLQDLIKLIEVFLN